MLKTEHCEYIKYAYISIKLQQKGLDSISKVKIISDWKIFIVNVEYGALLLSSLWKFLWHRSYIKNLNILTGATQFIIAESFNNCI